MKFFWEYLCRRRKEILVFLVFCAVFAVTFALYDLPVEAVFYPALLCAVLGGILVARDFVGMQKKHKRLLWAEQTEAALICDLPKAESIEEEDYQRIIAALQREAADLKNTARTTYRDMTDYYTVWVHQIKTPISSMKLTLQNEDTALSRRLSADLFRIEQYVEMVLAFLRLGSESSDYVFRECELDGIIRQSVKKFATEFIERKLKLCYEPTGAKLVTDEKWFSFCLEQILSNALKYTREGAIRIFLEAPKILCVQDTGIGIAPEDLPRIFEKGYTGHNGRRDRQASGLGLYLCRRICTNLGIRISADSRPGEGTVIRLDLEQYDLRGE